MRCTFVARAAAGGCGGHGCHTFSLVHVSQVSEHDLLASSLQAPCETAFKSLLRTTSLKNLRALLIRLLLHDPLSCGPKTLGSPILKYGSECILVQVLWNLRPLVMCGGPVPEICVKYLAAVLHQN